MSMKIERSTLEQVKARFAQNKKKLEEKKKDYDLEQRVKELKEEVYFPLYMFWNFFCIQFINKVISIIHRKKKSKNTERRNERIKRGRLRNCPRMMQDLLTKWLQSWDSLALARKKSDKLFLSNVCEQFSLLWRRKHCFFEEHHDWYKLKTNRNE